MSPGGPSEERVTLNRTDAPNARIIGVSTVALAKPSAEVRKNVGEPVRGIMR